MRTLLNTTVRTFFAAVLSGLIAFNAHAAIVYDEAVNGDLSNDHLIPTFVGLDLGENLISGSTVHQPSLDRDFFTITIGAGQTLNAIVLSSYTNTDNESPSQSFFGMAVGNGFTGLGFSDVDSWALIGAGPGLSVEDNLLAFLAGGPLGPGAYSFWHQETDGGTTYTFDYRVSEVPVPAALPLFLSGLLGIGAMARKAQRHI